LLTAYASILFIATLSMFSVAMARHRSNGGHCTQGAAPPQVGGLAAEKVTTYSPAVAPVQPVYYQQSVADPRFTPVAPNGQQYQAVPQQMPPQQYVQAVPVQQYQQA
jgi:hypothetical protein